MRKALNANIHQRITTLGGELMAKKRAALISLRFNPAFVQHLVAYAKALHQLDFEIEFLIDTAYRQFPELAKLAIVITDSDTISASSFTHAVFLNVSSHNSDLAIRLKSVGVRILYLYHEPWKTTLSYLKSDGIRSALRGAAAHHVSLPLLRLADLVVTGSEYALGVYKQKDARQNKSACQFPLIYDDEAGRITPEMIDRKEYFSYLGNIGHVHGFDQYVNVIRESLRRGSDMKFLIASRSPLPRFVLKDRIVRSNLDRITFLCGRTLQNSEINACYARSFCVWNLYRRSTQSGVLPKAFMFGTPVLVSRTGSFPEFVKDGFNGRYASAGDCDGVLSILNELRERAGEYATNCRSSFLDNFYYQSKLNELRQLLA